MSSPNKSPIEDLLGPSLMKNVKGEKITTASALKGKELVALYFSAKWCAPCRHFSPILKEFYKSCAEKGKIELVYISSDKNINAFNEYYESMPWLSLIEGEGQGAAQVKNNLAQKLQIQGIPTLIVLDVKTGKFVTAAARDDVTKVGGNADQGLEVIKSWKAIEPVAIEGANLSQGGGASGITRIIFFILKNPIYIFGLLYFYKQLMKYLKESPGDAGESIETEDVVDEADMENEDQEF